jgi:CO/xanthine dehydrogenase Mo-binding subunit
MIAITNTRNNRHAHSTGAGFILLQIKLTHYPAGSLMDYALPRADDLLSYDLGLNGTRCATSPLRLKGCGESGPVGAIPALTNAVLDALASFGVTNLMGPATAERIWHAIKGSAAETIGTHGH